MSNVQSRPPKETHLHTVHYEIEMFRYCAHRLGQKEEREQHLTNLLIEGFLLHFRNLLEFYSGEKHTKNRKDDLSTKEPETWVERPLTPAEATAVSSLQTSVLPQVGRHYESVSKYLEHCTTKRSDFSLSWDIGAMFSDMEVCNVLFLATFPLP